MGGVGKTRLAIEVAAQVAPSFADGSLLVSLAPVAEPGLVPSAVGRVLRVGDEGSRPVRERVLAALRECELLLVLDNFEHLLGGAPSSPS